MKCAWLEILQIHISLAIFMVAFVVEFLEKGFSFGAEEIFQKKKPKPK